MAGKPLGEPINSYARSRVTGYPEVKRVTDCRVCKFLIADNTSGIVLGLSLEPQTRESMRSRSAVTDNQPEQIISPIEIGTSAPLQPNDVDRELLRIFQVNALRAATPRG
jgi:hypothetical protein